MSKAQSTKRAISPIKAAENAALALPNTLVRYIECRSQPLQQALFEADGEYRATNPESGDVGRYTPATARIRGAIREYAEAAATGVQLDEAGSELRAAFSASINKEHADARLHAPSAEDRAYDEQQYAKALASFDATIDGIKTAIHESLARSQQESRGSGRTIE